MAWLTTTTLDNYLDARLVDELADDSGGSTPVGAILTEMLDSAKEYVETFLSTNKRYTPPLASGEVNASMRRCQAAIVRHSLFTRRGGDVPESVVNDFNFALDTLKRLRDGVQVVAATDESGSNAALVPTAAERTDNDTNTLGLAKDNDYYAATRGAP